MSNTLKYVDHTYRDFSRYIEEGGEMIKHKKSGNNFPARLHKILSEPTHSDVITWMPHGRAWRIIDKERLVSEVIPSYYVCKKYESFTRQLNGWGFKRLHQHGSDFGCYYHESFLRALPDLTCLVRRLPPNRGKATPFAQGEPNFYKISEIYPLPPSKSSTSTQESSKTLAASSDPSLTLVALSLSRGVSAPVASNGIARKIHDASPLSTTPSAPKTSATASSFLNSPHQAGGYYYPPSDRSNSQLLPYSANYTSVHHAGQYYGSSYGHYSTQGQTYPQLQYHPADPSKFHCQPPPARAPDENQFLVQRSYSHESHLNLNYNCNPSMPSSSVNCISHPKSNCCPEQSSEQDNVVDPFEPIPFL